MKQRPYRVGGGKNPESFERDFQTGIEEIQLAVFESVLRSSLTLPLQEPPLGQQVQLRALQAWPAQPL